MTPITDSRSRILIGLALAALMAATRGQQFAPLAHHLPDASLAVFFLAGLYLRSIWGFPALFGLATVIDLTAIGWGGVSGYCMTPAYWMLVPAYGVVWGMGRWSAGRLELAKDSLPLLFGALLVGGVLSEVFASGGFYLLSGRFADLSTLELLGRFATYMPATLLHLMVYVSLAAVVHLTLARALPGARSERASAMTDDSAQERHRRRMQRQKELVDARIARADQDCGVLVVNTGNGKGKSSSAFGMVARAMGHGMKVAVIQFIKGSFATGEEALFRRFPELEYHVMGEGFTWETQDAEVDRRAAMAAWDKAAAFLADPAFGMVVMDELNIALKLRLVPLDAVLDALQNRPIHQHAVVTGRAAPAELIEIADTVTEMRPLKHAFDAGIMAQKGVEL